MEKMQRKYDIASIGVLYWKSLELFAIRLEDMKGRVLDQSELQVDERFWVIFPSGTGFTRTSGVRVI